MANEDEEAGEQALARDYVALRDLVTTERLGSYLRWSSGDIQAAFALYEWNMTASAAILHTTGMVEVVVRNAMARALEDLGQRRGWSSWFDSAQLDQRGRADIRKARERAVSGASQRSTGRSSPSSHWAFGATLLRPVISRLCGRRRCTARSHRDRPTSGSSSDRLIAT